MLKGKTIIVSGAASGIGEGTVKHLAELGANVLALDVNDAASSIAVCEGASGELRAFTGDVRDVDTWGKVVDAATSEFGRIDGLANIAGIVRANDTVLDVDDETWDATIGINLRGCFLGMRAVLPTMLAQKSGSIVNISSTAAHRGTPSLAAYSASKGGIEALTRQAANEYAPEGVRINAVSPGPIRTPILTNADPDHVPARRLGLPDDIAGAVAYLISDYSAYVVGVVLEVDGGLAAAMA